MKQFQLTIIARAVVLLGLLALIYVPFLDNPFVFDDIAVFRDMPKWDFGDLQAYFSLRWLSSLSLKITWLFFIDDPIPHRLINLLIHACNCGALFFLIRHVYEINGLTKSWQSINSVAFSVALFASSPVAIYATGYILQRSILLATFFTLAMQLFFIKAIKTGRSRWYIWTTISYVCAIFSKEHAILSFLLLIALLFNHSKLQKYDYRKLTWMFVSITLIASYIVLMSKGVVGQSYEHDASMLLDGDTSTHDYRNLWLINLLTQSSLYFKYLALWCIPNPGWMSIDIRATLLETGLDIRNWWGLTCFLLYGISASYMLLNRGKAALVGFALIYPWLHFLVEFSTIRIQEPFVLYRSYLWAPGLYILFSLALTSIDNRKLQLFIVISLLMLNVFVAWNRLWTFSTEYNLWNDAVKLLENKRQSGAARIYYNRGNALLAKKEWALAIKDFRQVIEIHSEIPQPYYATAVAYYNSSNYESALSYFHQALKIKPDYAQAYFGSALAYKKLGAYDKANASMIESCKLGSMTACIALRKSVSN